MLTYESIRKILEDEKASPNKLVKIQGDFFKEAKEYLERKASIGTDEEWRIESAKRRVQDIIDMREKKIITMAMYSVRANSAPDNLAMEELELFQSIASAIKSYRDGLEKMMDLPKDDVVAVLKDVEQFVGINMKVYGPFKKGEIATLPKLNADLLVGKQMAERIEAR